MPSLVAFALASAILIGASITAYLTVRQTTTSSGEVSASAEASVALEQVLTDVSLARTAQAGYFLTRDPRYLDTYRQAVSALPGVLDDASKLIATDATQQSRLASLRQHTLGFLDASAARDEAIRTSDPSALVTTAEQVRTEGDAARGLVREMQTAETDLLREQSARADAAVRRTVLITAALTGFAILVFAGAYVFLSREIGRRRNVERDLERSLAKARDLYDHAPCGYHELDALGRIVSMNTTELNWLGFTEPEVVGRSFADLLSPTSRDLFEAQLQVGELAEFREFELTLRRRDATELPVLVAVRTLPEPAGAVTRMTVFDITERRLTQATIERLNRDLTIRARELEAANAELEAFCYSVSHDLRAPLRTIDGFSSALAEDYEDKLDEAGHHLLRRIRAATKHMGQLIDDLLSLSRVTRAELIREPIDLSATARAVCSELRAESPGRDVRCIIPDGISANADARLLRIVLVNLLGNSFKYTAKHQAATIEFGQNIESDGTRTYFVRDDGAGFDMRYADKLFGVFQRLHNSRDFPGTGVGLATVQRIVRRHGGEIRAEGEVEKGACVFFTLGEDDAEQTAQLQAA